MKPFDPKVSLAELRRRVRGGDGGGDPPSLPGKQPERLGDVLRRMRAKGELPRVKAE